MKLSLFALSAISAATSSGAEFQLECVQQEGHLPTGVNLHVNHEEGYSGTLNADDENCSFSNEGLSMTLQQAVKCNVGFASNIEQHTLLTTATITNSADDSQTSVGCSFDSHYSVQSHSDGERKRRSFEKHDFTQSDSQAGLGNDLGKF